jgi:2-C-methyl-D-erythritol 4-phosphate cytidylyltransferase
MGAGRNKALLELGGRPLLLHSVETFRACCDRLLLVAAEGEVDHVRSLVPDVPVVAGGATRHDSEWNALRFVGEQGWASGVVAIHDAARPLVAPADVRAVLSAAEEFGAAMLAQPALLPALELVEGQQARPERLRVQSESTRQPSRLLPGMRNVGPGKRFSTVRLGAAPQGTPRELTLSGPGAGASAAADFPAALLVAGPALVGRTYAAEVVWRAQTPQAARPEWLFEAYQRAAADDFEGTDTAAVLAQAGYPVRVVAASGENPKVTLAADLPAAEALLAARFALQGSQ